MQYPKSVRQAVIFTVFSWLFFLLSLYTYLTPGILDTRIAICAAVAIYFVYSVRNWGRMISLMGNAMAILYALFLCAIFVMGDKPMLAVLCAVNILLFSVASYFLIIKETANFFKTYRQSGRSNS